MIARLVGKIVSKREKALVIDVNGVGYLVFCAQILLEKTQINEEKTLHIFTRVAEGVLDLYGTESEEELALFEKLISVNGVGPKTALEFLNIPANKLKNAIISGDAAFLSSVKGIGKKTAEKICLDLRDKLELDFSITEEAATTTNIDKDAVDALLSFGYDKKQVERVMHECPADLTTTQERVKWGLAHL